MKKYISQNGIEISEYALKEIFDMFVFNENEYQDYEAWKSEKIEQGIIRVAE